MGRQLQQVLVLYLVFALQVVAVQSQANVCKSFWAYMVPGDHQYFHSAEDLKLDQRDILLFQAEFRNSQFQFLGTGTG